MGLFNDNTMQDTSEKLTKALEGLLYSINMEKGEGKLRDIYLDEQKQGKHTLTPTPYK